jgi:hypothetical protein
MIWSRDREEAGYFAHKPALDPAPSHGRDSRIQSNSYEGRNSY